MEYYIVLNGVKEGPFTLEELKAKGVIESTLVWKNGLADWVKAGTLPEVMQAITATPVIQEPTPQPQPVQQPQPQPAQQPQPQPAQQRMTTATSQGQQTETPVLEDYQQKNLILTIVSFLCCGMIGAVFALLGYLSGSEVKKLQMLGQHEMAAKKAAEAKKWFKVSIIVDLVLAVLLILYFVFVILLTFISR